MKTLLSLAALCQVLIVTSALAQTPTPSPTPSVNDKDDIVVISTSLIQLDATVTDKNGQPVTDLKQGDFEIYQNGKLQPITTFAFIALQPTRNTPEGPERTAATNAPPVAPGGIRHEQVRRTIALVVDDLGLSFASTRWTQQALRKFVDEQLQPGDLVAIIRTSSGVGALQQFTTDRRLLHAAIDKIRWNARVGLGFSPIEANLGETLSNVVDLTTVDEPDGGRRVNNVLGATEERESKRDAEETQEGIFAAGTLGAVNFVMRGMDQLPGRKAVILFSDGFKLFSRKGLNSRVQDGLQRLTDTANRSGVIIYTMDARGLDAPMLSAQDNTIGLTNDQVDAQLEQRDAEIFDTQQGLRAIATQTGGFAIINQNNLNKGIQQILDDQKSYYLLGYQPDANIFDLENRRFNKVTIKVTRPGLRVRYRSGFLGMTDAEARPQPKTPVQQLIAALTSPFLSRDIDLRLTSLFAGDAAAGTFMRSLIYIKPGDLNFKEDKDGWYRSEFDISVLTFGDSGEVVDQINRKQTVRAKTGYLKTLYEYGLVCSVTLPIQKPGAYQMRVAVRDAATGKVGSASQYIEVPNLKKKNLTLSGIVLERVDNQKSHALGEETEKLNLQRDAAIRRFRNSETIRFGLSVYNAKLNKAGGKPALTMQYRIFRDGKERFASEEKPLSLSQQDHFAVIDTEGAFSLGRNMQQGDYVVQVIVRDSLVKGGRQIATQWTDFEVIP